MFKNISLLSLLIALAVAGAAGSAGMQGYTAMTEKARAQEEAVGAFRAWKDEYNNLVPVEERWAADLHSVSEAKDLYSLYGIVGKEPTTNPDLVLVEKAERLVIKGQDLNATRLCLTSGGGNGLLFEEKDFSTLYKGLRVLAERPDVQMRDVTFTVLNGKARATVGDFCLLLQDGKRKEKTQ